MLYSEPSSLTETYSALSVETDIASTRIRLSGYDYAGGRGKISFLNSNSAATLDPPYRIWLCELNAHHLIRPPSDRPVPVRLGLGAATLLPARMAGVTCPLTTATHGFIYASEASLVYAAYVFILAEGFYCL